MTLTLQQQEESLMNEWREMLRSKGLIPVCKNGKVLDFNYDGIVDHELWSTLEERKLPKILFVLKETNKLPDSLIVQLARYGGNGRTWAGVAKWADALLFGKYSSANSNYRKKMISNISAINVKKFAGDNSSISEEIEDAIERNKGFLKRQINLYQPDIIVGCWHTHMAKFIAKDILQETEAPQWECLDKALKINYYISHVFGEHKSVLVIDMRHPCRARNIWADKLVAFRKSATWKELFGNRFIEV